MAERETLTDEELWKQAFPGDEDFEPASSVSSDEDELSSKSEPAPLVIGATVPQTEEPEDSSNMMKPPTRTTMTRTMTSSNSNAGSENWDPSSFRTVAEVIWLLVESWWYFF